MIDRRAFLKAGGIALFSAGAGPAFLARTAAAATGPGALEKRKVLVTIFQRGAMDALAAVPPLGDSGLRKLRPRLYMSAARSASTTAMRRRLMRSITSAVMTEHAPMKGIVSYSVLTGGRSRMMQRIVIAAIRSTVATVTTPAVIP